MTLEQALEKSRSKHIEVACVVGEGYSHFYKKVKKHYHYFHKKDELDKLADLEVIDTLTQEVKVMSLFAMDKAKSVKQLVFVVDTEQAKKVLGKERF